MKLPRRILKTHMITTDSQGFLRCVCTERNHAQGRWDIVSGFYIPLIKIVVPIRTIDSFQTISEAFAYLAEHEYAEYFTARR